MNLFSQLAYLALFCIIVVAVELLLCFNSVRWEAC